jgi:hypothetical protein
VTISSRAGSITAMCYRVGRDKIVSSSILQNVGIDKGDIPDLTKAPSSLLDALEQHLNHMEGKKSSQTSSSQSTR